MPTSYKVLGQLQGTASTSTYATLYTVPENTETIISTISVCNTSTSDYKFRIAIGTTTTPSSANWIVFDSFISGNDTSFITVSLTMDDVNKYMVISSESNSLSFSVFGSEIS